MSDRDEFLADVERLLRDQARLRREVEEVLGAQVVLLRVFDRVAREGV